MSGKLQFQPFDYNRRCFVATSASRLLGLYTVVARVGVADLVA